MQDQQLDELSGLILQARDRQELEVLLQGLLTPQELDAGRPALAADGALAAGYHPA